MNTAEEPRVQAVEFAGLLCSRLCHDLISPVGALLNGIELLAEETEPDMREHCLQLLTAGAQQTANRLRFFRLAFGGATGVADFVDTREARAALEGLYGPESSVEVSWRVEPQSIAKPAVKILLTLAMTAGETMLRGGRLDVAAENDGRELAIAITAEAPRLFLDPELRAALTGTADLDRTTPRAAATFLVHEMLKQAGATLAIDDGEEGRLVFRVRVPPLEEHPASSGIAA